MHEHGLKIPKNTGELGTNTAVLSPTPTPTPQRQPLFTDSVFNSAAGYSGITK